MTTGGQCGPMYLKVPCDLKSFFASHSLVSSQSLQSCEKNLSFASLACFRSVSSGFEYHPPLFVTSCLIGMSQYSPKY